MTKLDYKKYLYVDAISFVVCLALIMIFRPDIGMMISFLGVVLLIFITKRYNLFKFLSIAFIMAFAWQIIGGKEYFYGKDFIIFQGMNIFPLLAWTLGLFATYLLFFYAYTYIKGLNKVNALFLFILFFWIGLIIAETLAFHVFGFKNLSGAQYEGLPVCDCIHSPPWMQAVYLCLGPIYISLISFFRSKNNYEVFKK